HTMTWCEYHEATKHSIESLRRARHVLDWANMPDPFRHCEGVPVFDLPADPPAREIRALDVLQGTLGSTSVGDGPAFLSQLLFYSAAISASKLVQSTGYKYALRVNPSSYRYDSRPAQSPRCVPRCGPVCGRSFRHSPGSSPLHAAWVSTIAPWQLRRLPLSPSSRNRAGP